MPQMQVGRINLSTCVVAGYLYAFCGEGKPETSDFSHNLNSIERLMLTESDSDQKSQAWELIAEAKIHSEFTSRLTPVVCTLNSNEILIMGGKESKDWLLDDVFVMQADTMEMQKVASGGPIRFHATFDANQSAKVE